MPPTFALILMLAALVMTSACNPAPPGPASATPPLNATSASPAPRETAAGAASTASATAVPGAVVTGAPTAGASTAAPITPPAQPPAPSATATRVPERPAPTPAPSCFATPATASTGGEYVTAVAAAAERAWALVYTPSLTRTTVYVSDDAGATWTSGRFFNDFVTGITASPVYTRDRTIFATGAGGVYRSFNGGLSWGSITPTGWYTSSPIVRQFALSPAYSTDRLIVLGSPAAPRGVYASSDGGVLWRAWLVDAVDALFISPNYAVDRTVWAARNDEQTFRRDVMVTTTQGEGWEFVRSGSAQPLAISPAFAVDSTILWGDLKGGLFLSRSSDRLNPPIIRADTDALTIWQNTPEKGWEAVGEQPVQDIEFSAGFARNRTAYAVTNSALLVTRDGGTSWTSLCAWGFNAERPDAVRFNQLAVTPEETLLAGGAGARIAVSRDGGRSWTLTSLK